MTAAPETEPPRILSRADHELSREAIHGDALKVLYRLHKAGFLAHLVGGAVRDLLLGRTPKDYDVATDARPNQVRRLFRNSRIIGRRFRLVHVYFRDGIVEVSTFRGGPNPDDQSSAPGELLITDDNVFGTSREDAFRRDFTVNALFYNIADHSVIDCVGGIDDLRAGAIRAIGDPHIRFQEDPVRMMRACEYASRLGFTIEDRTQAGVWEQRREIEKAAPARLLEELFELLRSGHSVPAMQWMLELGLLEPLLPELNAVAAGGHDPPYHRIFVPLDRMVTEGRIPSEPALLASLLFPGVARELDETLAGGGRRPRPAALRRIAGRQVASFAARFRISRVRSERLVDTLQAVHRMAGEEWQTNERIRFAHEAVFDDALVLFELLGEIRPECLEDLEIWEQIARTGRRKAARGKPARRRRRRRRPKRRGKA